MLMLMRHQQQYEFEQINKSDIEISFCVSKDVYLSDIHSSSQS